MHTAQRSKLTGLVCPSFFLMREIVLSYTSLRQRERSDIQQGLEENQSLMLEMHEIARLFTQPCLFYKSIQRASCNPVLEFVRRKMFCILSNDYNILFSCNTFLLSQSLRENTGKCLGGLSYESAISIEQKVERHSQSNLNKSKIPFYFCLWSSCEQFLKSSWVLPALLPFKFSWLQN